MENEMMVQQLKALGDPTRLHVIRLLASCCCGKASVQEDGGVEGPTAGEVCCHITGAEKVTSTISHHLHELEGANLVKLEKRGKTTVCSLDGENLKSLGEQLILLSSGSCTCTNCTCCCCGNAQVADAVTA